MADILTKKSIQELKVAVNNEIKRREFYGNISSKATNYTDASKDLALNNNTIALASDINEKIINPLQFINTIIYNKNNNNNKVELKDEESSNPIIYYVNTALNYLDGYTEISKKDSTFTRSTHGCNIACTGFCSTTCGNGCGNSCSDTCSDDCAKNN